MRQRLYQHSFVFLASAVLLLVTVVPSETHAAACWQSGWDSGYSDPLLAFPSLSSSPGSTCLPSGSGPYGNFSQGWGLINAVPPSPFNAGTQSTLNFAWTGVGYLTPQQMSSYIAPSNWPQTYTGKFYVVDGDGYKKSTGEGVMQAPTVLGSYAGGGTYRYYLFSFPVSIPINLPSAGTYYIRSSYVMPDGSGDFSFSTYYYLALPFSVANPNSAPNTPTITGPTSGVTGQSYQFSISATDPDNNQVRYHIDWDNSGSVDATSSYGASGWTWSSSRSWSSAGTYTFRARAQDTPTGAQSNWRSHTIVISNPTPTDQCADGIDNDSDGNTDYPADQGCSSGIDNSESPNPPPPPPSQCSDGIDNNGNGKIDYPEDPTCSSATDNNEEIAPDAALALVSSPVLIQPNTSATLTWSASNVLADSCVLSGSNGDSWNLSGSSGTRVSSALSGETVFTLRCTDLNGDPISVSVTTKVAPSFQEI